MILKRREIGHGQIAKHLGVTRTGGKVNYNVF